MLWAIIAFMVIVAAVSLVRLRRGGPGPAIQGWLPKSIRPKMNEEYERHGWQKPYTDEGEHNPDRTQV